MQPGVGFWDTGEMQTVPYILGIGHPPGFPTFILIGWMFSHLFAIGTVAWRMNLMCALALALSAWLCQRIAHEETGDPLGACACALVFAFGSVVWEHATHTDVVSLTVLLAAVLVWALRRWRRTSDARYLLGAALSAGLALGNHLIIIWYEAGLLLYVIWNLRGVRVSVVVACAAAFVCGAAVYLYLPIRSAIVYRERLDPTLQLGLPPGKPFWDYAHPAQFGNFVWLVTGAQVGAASSIGRLFHVSQMLGSGLSVLHAVAAEFAFPFIAIALVGFSALARYDGLFAAVLVVGIFLTGSFATVFTAESDPARYYMIAYWIVAYWGACGAALIARAFAASASRRRAVAVLTAALGGLALFELLSQRVVFAQRQERSAQRYVRAVVAATPTNALLLAPWVPATPFAYAAYVERSLDRRIIDPSELGGDASYLQRWIKGRPVFLAGFERLPVIECVRFQRVDGGGLNLFEALPARCKAKGLTAGRR